MITEQFVNACCRIILSDNKSIPTNIVSDINDIISDIKETDIPLLFRKKYQFLTTLIRFKMDAPTTDNNAVLDSILTTGYFKDIDPYINGILQNPLTDEQVSKCIDSLSQKKNLVSIEKNGQDIEKFLDKLRTSKFTSSEEITKEWNNIISNVHSDIISKDRSKKLHDITDLDLLNDDYGPVINQIKLSYSGVNSISTGYESLDRRMYGGFAPSRLYMFCAPSGGGKSVMLINLIKNAVDKNLLRKDENMSIYIYISLENLIDESLIRLYSCLTNKVTDKIIKNYDVEKNLISDTTKEWLMRNNSLIKFRYFKPQQTNCFDILNYCNEVKSQYPNCNIRAIYIDYLDLMKPNFTSKNHDAYRLELGQVSIDMKTLAVLLRVPVITCTQVNRAAYDPKNKMNLSNVSESMKKVDNSDWIAMLQPREEESEKSGSRQVNTDVKIIDCKITKSRFGDKDFSIPFRANFSRFRFEQLFKSDDISIDTDIDTIVQQNNVADKITSIQNSNYDDRTEESTESDFNINGFY